MKNPSELLEEIKAIKDDNMRHYAMGNYCIALRNKTKELIDSRTKGLETIEHSKLENEVKEIMEMADRVEDLNNIIEEFGYREDGINE